MVPLHGNAGKVRHSMNHSTVYMNHSAVYKNNAVDKVAVHKPYYFYLTTVSAVGEPLSVSYVNWNDREIILYIAYWF